MATRKSSATKRRGESRERSVFSLSFQIAISKIYFHLSPSPLTLTLYSTIPAVYLNANFTLDPDSIVRSPSRLSSKLPNSPQSKSHNIKQKSGAGSIAK